MFRASSRTSSEPAGRPDHDQQHCYHHAPKVKPEAATAIVEFLMMGVRTPKTCWIVNKRQVINWRNCCIWFVNLFESFNVNCLLLGMWNLVFSQITKKPMNFARNTVYFSEITKCFGELKFWSYVWPINFAKTKLTLRWLMSYIYGAPILDVSRSHTTTQHSR